MAQQDNINVNGLSLPVWAMQSTAQQIDDATQRMIATPGSGAITAGDVGAAPDGYGLGASKLPIIDNSAFNKLLPAGFYMYYDTSNKIGDFVLGFLLSFGSNIGYSGSNQQVFIFQNTILVRNATRQNFNPEWDWLNPPMQLGVEYRTTERYNGKPVYAKLVNFGALPNGISASVSHNCENVLDVIFGTLKNQDGYLLNTYYAITEFLITRTAIVIKTSGDMSTNICTVHMKYTKTTD